MDKQVVCHLLQELLHFSLPNDVDGSDAQRAAKSDFAVLLTPLIQESGRLLAGISEEAFFAAASSSTTLSSQSPSFFVVVALLVYLGRIVLTSTMHLNYQRWHHR